MPLMSILVEVDSIPPKNTKRSVRYVRGESILRTSSSDRDERRGLSYVRLHCDTANILTLGSTRLNFAKQQRPLSSTHHPKATRDIYTMSSILNRPGAFTTRFAVPLKCENCKQAVSTSLLALPGVEEVSVDIPNQAVVVTGRAAPSKMIAAIEGTGRSAILRGSGEPGSSAICILETTGPPFHERVRGLARIIRNSPQSILIDLTVQGVTPGNYVATIRQTGDISDGAASTGQVWGSDILSKQGDKPRGVLGTVQVGVDKKGSAFLERSIQIWEIIGRSMILSRGTPEVREDQTALVGVIARSAGIWENDKKVHTSLVQPIHNG